MTPDNPTEGLRGDALADFIRDEVCCPRDHGCEMGGDDLCPAEMVRAALNAARATPPGYVEDARVAFVRETLIDMMNGHGGPHCREARISLAPSTIAEWLLKLGQVSPEAARPQAEGGE